MNVFDVLRRLTCNHPKPVFLGANDDGKTRFEYRKCRLCGTLFCRKLRGEKRRRAIAAAGSG
jgi:hypothetical protein